MGAPSVTETPTTPATELSPTIAAYLRAVHAIRERRHVVGADALATALAAQGVVPSPAWLEFETRYGGWVGSFVTLGVAAMQDRHRARLAGHALVGAADRTRSS